MHEFEIVYRVFLDISMQFYKLNERFAHRYTFIKIKISEIAKLSLKNQL
jgi:hypothetical protein